MNVALRQEKAWGRGRGALIPTLTVAYDAGRGDAPKRPSAQRNLVVAYRPGWQSPSDLATITRHVREIDPTIATYVVPTDRRNSVMRREMAKLPTLVVSNGIMPAFSPLRGKVYQGQVIPKVDELRLMEAAGLPVPKWTVLTPGLKLDPDEWGEFVILKPADRAFSSFGHGIQLMRTHRVRYRAPEEYPEGHPGRRSPMLVQRFIDTGENVTFCRVLTLFGEPLYALADRANAPRAKLTASDDEIETMVIASQAIKDTSPYLIYEKRFLDLARAAHKVLPGAPLKGCDILQDAGTGELYLLEMNSGGNTWHFSSAEQAHERRRIGAEFEIRRHMQFDAFRTAARVLVERTRAEAV